MANRVITKDVSDNVIAGAVMANFYLDKTARILEAHASDHTKVVVNKGAYLIPINIGNYWFLIDTATDVDIDSDLDTGSSEAGKDYYVYAVTDGSTISFKISLATTYPSGYDATTSRKIGGFHTLCVAAGTIAGHTLTGYLVKDILPQSIWDLVAAGTIAGHTLTGYLVKDILPQSIWDLKHRARCGNNAGMVYSTAAGIWVDIYLPSGTGASTVSVYGGTISDTRDWNDFVDDGGAVGKRLLTDPEFQLIAAGSNEQTNISTSGDPVTTGGHADTATQRMISNIGCEDCCGALWQWLQDTTAKYDDAIAAGWKALGGSKGQFYLPVDTNEIKLVAGAHWMNKAMKLLTKLIAGANWNNAANSGSRSRNANNVRTNTNSNISARFGSDTGIYNL